MNAPAPPARPTPPERGSPRGFTLVEVLVAIGLLTVIMLGVSFVFRAVTGAVGTGQALSAAARDARSAHSVMYVDAKNALRDEDPFMVIASTRRAAYLHSDDVAADPDKRAATLDINADGATTADGEDLDAQPALINYRNCRTDILGLFVRNVHRKQTGSGTQIVSPMGTRDAFVWYGHVAQAGQVGGTTYYNPGDGDPVANEVNYYSADWVLGRVVMLLADEVIDQSNVRQWAIDSTGVNPIPLAAGSYASADPQKRPIQASRTDLVQMSTETLLDGIKGYQLQNANWWKGLVYRFQAVPQPNVPLNGDGAALSSPLFLSHCRSFTVEFGGDFVTQQRDVCGVGGFNTPPDGKVTAHDLNHADFGQVIAAEPDGVTDFYTVPTGQTDPYTGLPERIERTRFYGLPRNTEPVGSSGVVTIPGSASVRRTSELTGVVPLRDVVRSGGASPSSTGDLGSFTGFEFERVIPPARPDYARPGAMAPAAAYTCVWGPSHTRPQLVRVVVTIEDPTQNLGVGQTSEFVLQLGR